MKKTAILSTVALVLAGALVACGGGGSAPTTGSGSAKPTASTAPKASASAKPSATATETATATATATASASASASGSASAEVGDVDCQKFVDQMDKLMKEAGAPAMKDDEKKEGLEECKKANDKDAAKFKPCYECVMKATKDDLGKCMEGATAACAAMEEKK